jgi:archaellum component FlaF (FlaF/FlaG flagellin family)
MSFNFQGELITYEDIDNYFEEVQKSKNEYKKKQLELKEREIKRFKESYEIAKNHEKFLVELNDRRLPKYIGNSSLTSIFKFKPIKIDYESKLKDKTNSYEITFSDDSSIDEISNLLMNVIENKKKKNKSKEVGNYQRLERKLNITILISTIAFISLYFIKK